MPHTVLITGVTSGLGRALAEVYTAEGARVIGVGRRPLTELDPKRFTSASYIQVDLSRGDAGVQVAEWCRQQGVSRIDLLIHNAALGWYGDFTEQSLVSISDVVAVNLKAPLALTHQLLPLLPQPTGKIVFISSVAAVLPTADYAVYTATKAALDGLARSLRIEFKGRWAIQVLHPGAINTGMHAKIGISPEKMDWDRFPPPEKIARQVVKAIGKEMPQITLGGTNRLLYAAGRFLPGVVRYVSRSAKTKKLPKNRPWRILITGAADGIGRALVERWVRGGHEVIGLDIDRERGEALAAALHQKGHAFKFLPVDLTDSAQLSKVPIQVTAPLDLVVHNAGISAAGRFEDLIVERQHSVIDLNLMAPLQLTALLARSDLLVKGAGLIFLSSLSKFTGYPGAAAYAATKDGLASYAASLHAGGRGGIWTSVVYPGPTRTAHARRYSPDNSRESRRMPPETVASIIADKVAHRKPVIIPGLAAKFSAGLGFLFPAFMEEVMRRVIFEKLDRNATR